MATPITSLAPSSGLDVNRAKALGIGKGLSIGPGGQVQTAEDTAFRQSLAPAAGKTAPVAAPITATVPKVQSAPPPVVNTQPTQNNQLYAGLSDLKNRLDTLAATAQNQPQAQAQTQPSFGGLIGSVQSASQPNQQALDYAAKAAQYGAGSIPIAQQARDIAQQFGQKYADIGQQGARFEAGQLTTGTTPVAEGNAAITAQTTAAQQQALAEGEQAALQGIGYGLTGQQQAAQAAQAAAGVPLTAQQQQLGGLESAAGLAQPSPAAVGQTVFQPLEGGFAGGAGGLTPEVLQGYAQMAATGQLSQVPSAITSNPVLFSQINEMAKQINPNYNPVLSQASAQTQAQGQQLQTQAQAANSALDTLQGLYNQLSALGGGTGLKPFNKIEQAIGGLLGSPSVSQYQTTLQEARAKVAGVLSASGGVTPTNADAMANDYLPDGMTPQELPAKIQAAKTLIQQTVGAFVGSGQPQAPSQTQNASTREFHW